jgi:hypothetical protein
MNVCVAANDWLHKVYSGLNIRSLKERRCLRIVSDRNKESGFHFYPRHFRKLDAVFVSLGSDISNSSNAAERFPPGEIEHNMQEQKPA